MLSLKKEYVEILNVVIAIGGVYHVAKLYLEKKWSTDSTQIKNVHVVLMQNSCINKRFFNIYMSLRKAEFLKVFTTKQMEEFLKNHSSDWQIIDRPILEILWKLGLMDESALSEWLRVEMICYCKKTERKVINTDQRPYFASQIDQVRFDTLLCKHANLKNKLNL
jgi:hypothetical protein